MTAAQSIVREWAEHDMNEHYGSDYLRDGFGSEHLEQRIAAALASVRKEAREAKFRIWHSANEEMAAHKELLTIHKGVFSIGAKRELALVNFIDAWCTTEDLVKCALEALANSEEGEMNG